MEYLQYYIRQWAARSFGCGFKPYYKWNTFNTAVKQDNRIAVDVLNLIINGIPSIPFLNSSTIPVEEFSFKPYYKWNTFNT